MRKRKYTNEQLEKAVLSSFSYTEVIRKIGLRPAGGTHCHVKKIIKELDFDTSHFRLNGRRGFYNFQQKRKDIKDYLLKDTTVKSTWLKKRLVEEGIFKNECFECGQWPIWKGKKLVLELDHIDGDIHNNLLKNLRILCPNCHSQTCTFIRRKCLNKNFCTDCGKEISKKAKRCSGCANKLIDYTKQRKVKVRPSSDELLEMLKTMSWCAIGRKYGVSDNAVRKWAKQYELI